MAKGKGELQTYWLEINLDNLDQAASSSNGTYYEIRPEADSKGPATASAASSTIQPSAANRLVRQADYDQKIARLVGWNVEAMSRMLREIVAKRMETKTKVVNVPVGPLVATTSSTSSTNSRSPPRQTILDCATDFVQLTPSRSGKQQPQPSGTTSTSVDASKVQLDARVVEELKELVTVIAAHYRRVPFHNFEHASHVAMSVSKLLTRMVKGKDGLPPAPQESAVTSSTPEHSSSSTDQTHDYRLIVTSDPMTHFACFFTALIHDMDHQGVPNATLVREQDVLAKVYGAKSVAEQNSVGMAWDVLCQDQYRHLRQCIYANQDEMIRFRQLLVNLVMATDVMDKELGQERRAMGTGLCGHESSQSFILPSRCRRAKFVRIGQSQGDHCLGTRDSSVRCQSYHATLARLSEMERTLVSRNVCRLPTGSVADQPGRSLVYRGIGLFGSLRLAPGVQIGRLWRLWRGQ